jgi:chromosome segregation ATPase
MRHARRTLIVLILLTLVSAAWAKRRDPLTETEADQLREAALEPQKRLMLLIKFTSARLDAIEQLRADPKEADGRGAKIHDLLEDFTALLDELNDNLDQYQGRPLDKDDKTDFRKGIKAVMAACDQFDIKLKNLRAEAQSNPQTRKELPDFQFVLQDAQDALQSSLDVAKEYFNTKDADAPKKKP